MSRRESSRPLRGVAPPSRRAVLRGAGAALTLPWLPSLAGRAEAQEPPPRLIVVFTPNGQVMDRWTPEDAAGSWLPSPTLQPLTPWVDEATVITGLHNEPAEMAVPNQHPSGTAAFLTGQVVGYEAGGGLLANGVSMDQVAARSLPPGTTPFPSLQVGVRTRSPGGHCGQGAPCAYFTHISWADAQTPLPNVSDPLLLFDRLFAGGGDGDASAERRALRRSVLDSVLDESERLRRRLGSRDQAQLEQYLDGVRELELRVDGLAGFACEAPPRPEVGEDPTERIDATSALVAHAVRCDLTRVVTFMFDMGASNRSFDFLGHPGGHHGYSHHGSREDRLAALADIEAWQTERFANLLAELAAVGVLDHTLCLWGSELGDGSVHSHRDLPILLAGGRALGADPGRHLRFPAGAPLARLHASLLAGFGSGQTSFGLDGDAPLPGLFA